MTPGVTRHVSCARVAVPALGRDGMLVVLAGAAGVMDAVAYLGLGVFTTMMTGNTARWPAKPSSSAHSRPSGTWRARRAARGRPGF